MDFKKIKEFGRKLLKILILAVESAVRFLKQVWKSGVIQKYTRTFLHYLKVFALKLFEWTKKLSVYLGIKIVEYSKIFYDYLKNFRFTLDNVFVIITIIFTIKILFLLFLSYKVNYEKSYFEGEKKFRVIAGKTFTEIAEDLEKDSIISSAYYFKIAAKLQEKDGNIISRTYIFKPGMNNNEVLGILSDPSLNFTVKFTVLEGMRIKQIAKSCANKFNITEKDFIKETENDSLINVLGLRGKVKNLEGFLFPDTYRVPVDITAREMVLVLFNEFYRKFVLNEQYDFKENPKRLLEKITLASIVQGETQIEEEMPVIAGVYMNRIAKRMRLEADPTIQYVLPDGPKQRLMKSDLKIDSPYNTYLNYGLPPGPINNPGLKCIEAAINPGKHDYIFFVATGKGGHTFTSTYKEHLEAVKEYKKNVKQQ